MPTGAGISTEDDTTATGGLREDAASLAIIKLLREKHRTMMKQQQEQQCSKGLSKNYSSDESSDYQKARAAILQWYEVTEQKHHRTFDRTISVVTSHTMRFSAGCGVNYRGG